MAVVELTQSEDGLRDSLAMALKTEAISAVFIKDDDLVIWTIDGAARSLRLLPDNADSVYRKIRDAM